MTIETKFSVGDLLKGKYDKGGGDYIHLLDVLEVISNSCYAGTQVFYLCRCIMAEKKYEQEWEKEGEFKWIRVHSIGKEDGDVGWKKYREDELIRATDEEVKLFND